MKVRVNYYLLDSNGVPDAVGKYEVVEIKQNPGDAAETLLAEALSKKLNVSKKQLKVMGTAEI